MSIKNIARSRTAALITASLLACSAHASEMVYFPLNPSFGGNPLNGPYFLGSAQATNKHRAPDPIDTREQLTPLQQFNEALERQVISRLATAASSRIMAPDGSFIPGTLETDSYTIHIVDRGDGFLSVTTIDKLFGGSTTFQVSK